MQPGRLFIYFLILAAGVSILLVALGPKSLIYPDAMEYADTARGFSRGDGMLDRATWIYQLSFTEEVPPPATRRAVGFPAVLALAFRVFGASDRVAHGTSIFFFFLSLLLVYALALQLGSSSGVAGALGAVAGLLALFDPNSLLYAASGLSEPMFACAVLAVAWLIARETFGGQWVAIGLLVGLGQWIRLNGFTLLAPCLAAAWILDRRGFARNALAMAAGCAVPLLLLAVRNYLSIGRFSFVGINGAIIYNQLGDFTAHGIERELFIAPDSPPSPLWILRGHAGQFVLKAWHGLDRNLLAAMTATSPLAWGALGLYAATRWSRAAPRLRALIVFASMTALLWVALYSIGEFEGSRFYVPVSGLVLVLAVVAGKDLLSAADLSATSTRLTLGLLAALMIFPGVHRLSQLLGQESPGGFRRALGAMIAEQTEKDAVVLSDVPWAVAWYGDRSSVWIPRSVAEVGAIKERTGATYVLLTALAASNAELDEGWRELYYSRGGPPPGWRPVPTGGLRGSVALYRLGP